MVKRSSSVASRIEVNEYVHSPTLGTEPKKTHRKKFGPRFFCSACLFCLINEVLSKKSTNYRRGRGMWWFPHSPDCTIRGIPPPLSPGMPSDVQTYRARKHRGKHYTRSQSTWTGFWKKWAHDMGELCLRSREIHEFFFSLFSRNKECLRLRKSTLPLPNGLEDWHIVATGFGVRVFLIQVY